MVSSLLTAKLHSGIQSLICASCSAMWLHTEEPGVTAHLQVSNSSVSAVAGALGRTAAERGHEDAGDTWSMVSVEPVIRLVVKNLGLVNLVLL